MIARGPPHTLRRAPLKVSSIRTPVHCPVLMVFSHCGALKLLRILIHYLLGSQIYQLGLTVGQTPINK